MSKNKIGRNQLCHCGSGKKYKKCCLNKKSNSFKNISKDIEKEITSINHKSSDVNKARKDNDFEFNLEDKNKDSSEEENINSRLKKLLELSQILIKQKNILQAKEILTQALEISNKHNIVEIETGCRIALSELDGIKEQENLSFENLTIGPSKKSLQKPSKLSLDYYFSLAKAYKSQNIIRESLYYFEEAIHTANVIKDRENELKAYIEFSKILNSTNKYEDVKSLYNYAFYNKSRRFDFTCQSSGDCCKHFKINIYLFDALKILKNRPDLKPEDFLLFDQGTFVSDYLENKENYVNNRETLTLLLKKVDVEDETRCFFLSEEGKCSIHSFKPYTCKNWPMVNLENDHVIYELTQFIKEKCNYCVTPDNLENDEEIKLKSLKESKNLLSIHESSSVRLKKYMGRTKEKLSKAEILKFLLASEEKEEEFLNKISNFLANEAKVIKVSSSFNIKALYSTEVPLAVFIKGDIEEFFKYIHKKIKSSFDYISLIPTKVFGNESILISLEPDYSYQMIFYSEDKLISFNEVDERILYQDKDYNFPKPSIVKKIPKDKEIYKQLTKACLNIISFDLKRGNITEVKKVYNDLILLYSSLPKENYDLRQIVINSIFKSFKFIYNEISILNEQSNFNFKRDFIKFLIYNFVKEDSLYLNCIFDISNYFILNNSFEYLDYIFELMDEFYNSNIEKVDFYSNVGDLFLNNKLKIIFEDINLDTKRALSIIFNNSFNEQYFYYLYDYAFKYYYKAFELSEIENLKLEASILLELLIEITIYKKYFIQTKELSLKMINLGKNNKDVYQEMLGNIYLHYVNTKTDNKIDLIENTNNLINKYGRELYNYFIKYENIQLELLPLEISDLFNGNISKFSKGKDNTLIVSYLFTYLHKMQRNSIFIYFLNIFSKISNIYSIEFLNSLIHLKFDNFYESLSSLEKSIKSFEKDPYLFDEDRENVEAFWEFYKGYLFHLLEEKTKANKHFLKASETTKIIDQSKSFEYFALYNDFQKLIDEIKPNDIIDKIINIFVNQNENNVNMLDSILDLMKNNILISNNYSKN